MELDLKLAKRNARFRAWVAHGLPISGGWRLTPGASRGVALLEIACRDCACFSSIGFHAGEDLRLVEEVALMHCDNDTHFREGPHDPCRHIRRLRGEDPPEVKAICELELLAGG